MKKKLTTFHGRFIQQAIILLVCLFSLPAIAQTTSISGGVTSASDNQPLPGVTITERGTQNGTTTNASGNYSLTVQNNAILIFSTIGFTSQEVRIAGRNTINVALQEENQSLDEVVVIGYGTARRRDIVGATSTVSAKEAGANTATSPAQLLVGKAAGVQVLNTSGTPGSGAQIIVRGTGSFTSVDPLYVIDGIQGDSRLFNTISNQDIETITVLKDAASTAIYGAAAANGVVIITTKRASKGAPSISFNTQYGVSKAWRQLDLLNAAQYVELFKDIASSKNVNLPAKLNTAEASKDVTDWQKEVFKSAMTSENNVNINGGSENVLYNFSAGLISQDAIVQDYNNKRFTSRLSLDETLGRFHFGQSLNVRYSKSVGQVANLGNTIGYAPYQPIYDASVPGGFSIVSNVNDFSDVGNPLQPMGVQNPKSDSYVFFPQVFGEVNIIEGLTFRSQAAATFAGGKGSNYQIPYTASNNLFNDRRTTASLNTSFTYTLENYLSFNRIFDKHAISATLGTSYIDAGNSSNIDALGTGLSNDEIRNIAVALTPTINGLGVGYGTQFGRLISYFGRVIYTYNDKYTFSASMRRDGSSNFGKNNQYGNFPGVGLAWNFVQEDFIKNGLPFLSDGKLRAGWGRTGNNKFAFGLASTFTYSGSPNGDLVYSFGSPENFVSGTSVNLLANPNLKWEQTDQTDIGLDLGFLENRLTLTVDLYDRKSTGLLVAVPVPPSIGVGGISGRASAITFNAADARNKGIELALGYRSNLKSGFNYNINLNGSFNKNETLSLGQNFQAPIKDGTFNQLNPITYTAKGSPIGSFYGFRVSHVAKDQAEIDALNAAAALKTGVAGTVYQAVLSPGDFIFKDLNNDGIVDENDQEVLGSPMPKFLYGLNLGANYKMFDLNIVLSGVTGVKLVNGLKYFTESATTGHNSSTAMLDRWRKPGDIASLPRAGQHADASGNLRQSDFFVENGSYLRARNITLGYTFSDNTLNSIIGNTIKNLRIYIAAQNLFTITDYKGYDPEISTQNSGGGEAFIFRRGIDSGQLPQPRTFMAGLQIGF